jgi:hypothetical protein
MALAVVRLVRSAGGTAAPGYVASGAAIGPEY